VVSQRNKGYGGALKLGFETATYDWIFFTDADLQFDLRELKKLIEQSSENDLVIGFRTKRAEGLERRFLAFALKAFHFAMPLH